MTDPGFKRRHMVIAGRTVSWLEAGSGPPLVLLHGAGFDHAALSWSLAAPRLVAQHRVLIPDLPGYGQSAPVVQIADLSVMGEWVVQWAISIGLARADFAGTSMGGGIALWLAIHYPDLVRSVSGVAPYGLMRRSPMHLLGLVWRVPPLSAVFYGLTMLNMRRSLRVFAVEDDSIIGDTLLEGFTASFRAQNRTRRLDAFLDAEITTTGLRSVLVDSLDRVRAPVLLIHGRRDPVIPIGCSRRAVGRIAGARLEELPGKHLPHLEHPARVAGLIGAHSRTH